MREGYGVGMWKAIRGSWEIFKGKIGFKVGSRSRVKFLKDKWCGDIFLQESFLELYSIASSKND